MLVGGASDLAFSGLLNLIGPGVGRVGAGSTRLIGHHSDDSLKALDDIARYADDLAGAACSFSGATLVLLADGSRKRIEDVDVGDKVLATDPQTDFHSSVKGRNAGTFRQAFFGMKAFTLKILLLIFLLHQVLWADRR